MELNIEKIDGQFYISHIEIARTSADFYGITVENVEAYAGILKNHIIKMRLEEELPEVSIIKRDLNRLVDSEAFFALAKNLNWSEDYVQPIMVGLGEWGEEAALEVQTGYKQTEAAA